jgi:hypothetical protein
VREEERRGEKRERVVRKGSYLLFTLQVTREIFSAMVEAKATAPSSVTLKQTLK